MQAGSVGRGVSGVSEVGKAVAPETDIFVVVVFRTQRHPTGWNQAVVRGVKGGAAKALKGYEHGAQAD